MYSSGGPAVLKLFCSGFCLLINWSRVYQSSSFPIKTRIASVSGAFFCRMIRKSRSVSVCLILSSLNSPLASSLRTIQPELWSSANSDIGIQPFSNVSMILNRTKSVYYRASLPAGRASIQFLGFLFKWTAESFLLVVLRVFLHQHLLIGNG